MSVEIHRILNETYKNIIFAWKHSSARATAYVTFVHKFIQKNAP